MFEHFTFGALAQPRYYQDETSASPTDTSFSARLQRPSQQREYPFPEVTSSSQPEINEINNIVDLFSSYNLRPDDNEAAQPSICPDANTSSPTFDDNDEDLVYLSTRSGPTHLFDRTFTVRRASSRCSPPRDSISCKRTQRQLHTQFQLQAFPSTNAPIRDRSSLVENMISSNEQCTLHNSASRSSPRSSPSPTQTHHCRVTGDREENLVIDDGQIAIDEDMDVEEGYRGNSVDSLIPQSEAPSFPPEDEGFSEMDSDEYFDYLLMPSSYSSSLQDEMRLRRASTPSGIRKYSYGAGAMGATTIGAGGYGSNAVVMMGNGNGVGYSYAYGVSPREKYKVRSLPRMRKRKNHVKITE